MTPPRPEALELAELLSVEIYGEVDRITVQEIASLIDAALTAAREEQREKDAAVIDRIAGREHGRDQSIMLLCARAIREVR